MYSDNSARRPRETSHTGEGKGQAKVAITYGCRRIDFGTDINCGKNEY